MADTMKAAYLTEAGKVEYREIPVPKPAADQALVEVMSCGVCGSDVHYYEHGRIGSFVVDEPLILGHECAGVVVEAGKNVTDLKPGDRVAVEPGVPCRRCEHCKSGRYNLCLAVEFLATPPFHGAFTEYIAHPSDFLFKLPAEVSLEEGAMIEPFSVGLHAAARGGAGIGQTAVVLGTGPIGLCTVQALKAYGVSNIIATDMAPVRLRLAEKLGASTTINASETDTVDAVMHLTCGRGADIVCETAGAVPTVRQTPAIVARGGCVVLVGLPPANEVPYDVVALAQKEADIFTIFRYANVYAKAVALLAERRVDLKSMITSRYGLGKVPEALAFAAKRTPDTIKIMVNAED
jgi:L-iditol 2-dehydrogenase